MDKKEMAKYLDDTLLKADATPEQIVKICEEAKTYGCASVCVNSSYVPLVAKELSGSEVKTCCVIGFPLGACTSESKAAETADSIEKGQMKWTWLFRLVVLKPENGIMLRVI